jgi:hypothetical protein
VTGQTWLIIGVSAVAGIGLGAFVLMRTNWFKIRKYAIDMKQVYDRHKDLQQKTEALQSLQSMGGAGVQPMILKQRLKDVIGAMQSMIADMEKVKSPGPTKELHQESLTMHRESVDMYRMMLVGTVGKKAMEERQKKLMKMQTSVQEKTEKLYGKPPEPKKKKK